MTMNNSSINNTIQSLDISLKQVGFISIDSNLSLNALYKILIKNPRLVNMTDEKKETFLSYAIKRNNNPIINLILTSPILDLTYQDKKGNTYLHISIIQQNIKLVASLLEKGIFVNEKNNDGNTALHFAYYINNMEIVKLLINYHINTSIKNNQGFTAEEVIPTNDIDKIAGFEVDMNFDDNIYDELKYNSNENNEIYDLNKNKKNVDSSGSGETRYKSQISKNKIGTKDKKINYKKKNNFKNKNNIVSDNTEDQDDDIITLPFHCIGNSNRKISNIDRIYYENDRFIRKESENFPFYTELISSNNGKENTPLKNEENNNLSNIIENRNISENNSNNNSYNNSNNKNFENDDEKKNNTSLIKNSIKNNIVNNNSSINGINDKINFTNRPLLEFLNQINMQQYYLHLKNNGLEYINIIIEDTKKGVYITDNQLKMIGINKPGDRAKILIRIQEKANLFEYSVPKSVYYNCTNLKKIEDDPNVNKLYEWLKNIRLEQYLSNFLTNGYCSIDILFFQLLSNQTLTDEILKDELEINKLGHRTRIFNKLKEEIRSYENQLKGSIISFQSQENSKICSECIIF